MTANDTATVFGSKRRIKLGIWGLGRGMDFFRSCEVLGFDVVAGCDFNDHMREKFAESVPDVFVTADEDEFLSQDIDAVLVATFCPTHARDAIKALESGKHVLSEVTSFHTVAEGVALVEAVEQSGLVYNLAENYPFSKANMYVADKWRHGLFGEFMYAEYEYVHECRVLQYTYIDGVPVDPGWTLHNWRSWINIHYYNTHSLGPVMYITGDRPTRVVALPGGGRLAGYAHRGDETGGMVAPSLISFAGGGLMRNLMGQTTDDTWSQRIWGSLGSAEFVNWQLSLRLGASGGSPKLGVEPDWPIHRELASATGHGGGDFWILYFFAREIHTGEPAPFDIYRASDCTLPGILARLSAKENGRPFDIPDLRGKASRDAHRHDISAQGRFDVENGVFPQGADTAVTGEFTSVMKRLIAASTKVRAYADWQSVFSEVKEGDKVVALGQDVLDSFDEISSIYAAARAIEAEYPDSVGGRCLREMLEVGLADELETSGYVDQVRERVSAMAGGSR